MALCDFCFRDKSPLQPIYPRTPVNVCKACFFQIDRVVGFLRHSGIALVAQSELSVAGKELPKPPKVPKAPRKKIGAVEPLSPSPTT